MQLLLDFSISGGGQIGINETINIAVSPQSGALRGPRIKPCRSEMNSARPRFCRRQNACAPRSGDVMDGWRPLLLDLAVGGGGQVGVDKPVNIAVHDGLDVAHFVAGAGVLGQGIGHEHIGADLAAPLDLHLHAL